MEGHLFAIFVTSHNPIAVKSISWRPSVSSAVSTAYIELRNYTDGLTTDSFH